MGKVKKGAVREMVKDIRYIMQLMEKALKENKFEEVEALANEASGLFGSIACHVEDPAGYDL
jgi:hypothetical protein